MGRSQKQRWTRVCVCRRMASRYPVWERSFRDYNNDGKPDILFTALAGQTFPLFQNLGRGAFRDATNTSRMGPLSMRRSGWGLALADFDNDGWKDFFVACSHVTDNIEELSGDRYKQANAIFRNLGNATFSDVSGGVGEDFTRAAAHRGLAVADLDNDGKLDAVVTVLGETPELWHNVSAGASNWVAFHLRGRKSNRDGLGAEIRVNGQVNQQSSSQGYASGSLGPVHFGLGRRAVEDPVEIRWPSGRIQRLTKVPMNRVVLVVEPD